jgi:crossover junction endodeoxyribonuclease RuvC
VTIAMGLDLSLTGSGVAVLRSPERVAFSDDPAAEVYTFGERGSNSDTLYERIERIERLVELILGVVHNSMEWPDVVMIEQPAYDQSTGKTHDRSGLWWDVVRSLAKIKAIPVIEVGTSKVKIYATGKGTNRKDAIMAAAIRRYPEIEISNNNESDAAVLAAMGMRLLGAPIEESLPQTHLRAMEGLVLP